MRRRLAALVPFVVHGGSGFTVGRLPTLDEAAREALAGAGGTTRSGVVIRYELRYIPFVDGPGRYRQPSPVTP